MFAFRWGKKDESEKETLGSYKLQGTKKEPIIKLKSKGQVEKNANKKKKNAIKKKKNVIKFKAPGRPKNKKKKNSFFSFARFNFFGRSKRKRTPRAAQRSPQDEAPPQRKEVKGLIKRFEVSKGKVKQTTKGAAKGVANETAKGVAKGVANENAKEAAKGTTEEGKANVGKAKAPTQTSAAKADPQRSDAHAEPIENEELFEVLTEEERKSIEVVSLIDGSSNGDSSEADRDGNDDSVEKDVPVKMKSAYSVKKQKSGLYPTHDKGMLVQKSSRLEGTPLVDKEKSPPQKNKQDEKDLVITPNSGADPGKEMQTKKSILKNILKMPLSYASRSFKRGISETEQSAKLGKAEKAAVKDTTHSIHLQSDLDKGDVSPREEVDAKSEDTNYSGKMNFNKFIPNFNLTSKKNATLRLNKKKVAPMISSKLKMNKKNSHIGSSFDQADDLNAAKLEESTLTRQDIRAKKNHLIGRAKLMEKNLHRSIHATQEDGAKNIHRKMTNDFTEGGGIPFDLHPPLLLTENSFDICPISPIEDIIEVINSICNNNKEEAVAKLKMCKENNEKCSSVLKITLDKLNGPEDSVLSNLTKNMSLQRDYLLEVNEVMRAVSED
ncbi:unnamed protein product [Plasmodium vivax]|uniref:(malaria parasite P. vivax) hypothetical protein n=1 Tax=Plasmodium vivax TaxID=5855 RepID=A0A8S4HJD0_PLAVI|nr:unnamed protein product [Plasmodium vivax]